LQADVTMCRGSVFKESRHHDATNIPGVPLRRKGWLPGTLRLQGSRASLPIHDACTVRHSPQCVKAYRVRSYGTLSFLNPNLARHSNRTALYRSINETDGTEYIPPKVNVCLIAVIGSASTFSPQKSPVTAIFSYWRQTAGRPNKADSVTPVRNKNVAFRGRLRAIRGEAVEPLFKQVAFSVGEYRGIRQHGA
jgi:hypothetical protein